MHGLVRCHCIRIKESVCCTWESIWDYFRPFERYKLKYLPKTLLSPDVVSSLLPVRLYMRAIHVSVLCFIGTITEAQLVRMVTASAQPAASTPFPRQQLSTAARASAQGPAPDSDARCMAPWLARPPCPGLTARKRRRRGGSSFNRSGIAGNQ